MLKSIQQAILTLSFFNTEKGWKRHIESHQCEVQYPQFLDPDWVLSWTQTFCWSTWDCSGASIRGNGAQFKGLTSLPAPWGQGSREKRRRSLSSRPLLPARNGHRSARRTRRLRALRTAAERSTLWKEASWRREWLCCRSNQRRRFPLRPSPLLSPFIFLVTIIRAFLFDFSYNEIHEGEDREVFEENYKPDRRWLFRLF